MLSQSASSENPSWFDAYKAGDADRYIEIFQLHYRPVYYYAMKTLGEGSPYLDDVVNTAFTLAWEARDQIDSPTHLRNYLYKVVKHRATSAYRTLKASRKIAHQYLTLFNDTEDESAIDLERVWSRVLDAVYAQLENLPNGHVLKMIYIEGLSTQQIAKALNTTENNVYIMKSRALKQLRTRLGKDFPFALVIAALNLLQAGHLPAPALAYPQKETVFHQETVLL